MRRLLSSSQGLVSLSSACTLRFRRLLLMDDALALLHEPDSHGIGDTICRGFIGVENATNGRPGMACRSSGPFYGTGQ
jgi:hypothetical protein